MHFPPLLCKVPLRGRAVAARRAHNPEVVGSNPTPATSFFDPKMTQIKSIDADVALDYIRDTDCVLLDVRSPGEFEGGHLEGAINLPVLELHLKVHELPLDKEIVIYCAHGVRSGKAAHYLLGNGFHKVAHISGGIEAMNA